MVEKLSRRERFRGVILGTAVGDALGLPAEGISRRRRVSETMSLIKK